MTVDRMQRLSLADCRLTDCMAYCRADQSADVVTDSASSERVFSTAGMVLEKQRNAVVSYPVVL